MAYTSKSEVTSLFNGLTVEADTGDEATNTIITDEEMAIFIADADAEINAKLHPYYNIPIVQGTSPESFILVAKVSKYFTAHNCRAVLNEADQYVGENILAQPINYGKKGHMLLKSMLPQFNKTTKQWEEPITPLYDAVAKSFRPNSGSLVTSHNIDTDSDLTFTKGGDNW